MRRQFDRIATLTRPQLDVNRRILERNSELGTGRLGNALALRLLMGKREVGACLRNTYAVPNGTLNGWLLARVPRLSAAGCDISSLRDLERNAELGTGNSELGNAEFRTRSWERGLPGPGQFAPDGTWRWPPEGGTPAQGVNAIQLRNGQTTSHEPLALVTSH